jgi:transposase
MDGFTACFEGLDDPRTGNAGRHDLLEMLMIALCTVLSGGEDCTDMAEFARLKLGFLRGFLKLEHGAPSHDTFSRLFRLLARPVDFRKGAHSLAALAQEVLAEDPFAGAVIVYRAKRSDRLKILVWDTSGLVLVWKQLQQGSFRWPPIVDGVMKLSPVEFAALFDGLDWTRVQTVKGILKPSVAA